MTAVAARRRPPVRRIAPVRLVALFVLLLAGDLIAQLVCGWSARHAPGGGGVLIGVALALAAVLIAVYCAVVRAMERRKAGELIPGARQGLTGVGLGAALFTIVLVLLEAMGVVRWRGLAGHFGAVAVLAASIVAAVGEELAFRGGVFRILEESFGTSAALVLSSGLFGLAHALNPGATPVSTLAIALDAGALLGAAYACSGNLWFPIGIHLGWNVAEGGVFGVSVSGVPAGKGLFGVTLAGPTLLTGGAFGPEASIVAVMVCLAAAVALIALTVGKGRWIRARVRLVLD